MKLLLAEEQLMFTLENYAKKLVMISLKLSKELAIKLNFNDRYF